MAPEQDINDPERRSFLTTFLAGLTTALAGLIPPLTGLGVLLDPLRKKSSLGKPIHVTNLAALPADGAPRKFSVVTDLSDAWNQFRNVPIGAVYLRRTEETTLEAFNVECPHAGCFVDYRGDDQNYLCPCHNSRFNIDGSVQDPNSPSPRGLDSLDVELRNGDEVWVRFQKFQAGKAEKQPRSKGTT
ncbi:MAG: Cytochrome b6-f complex iron-sulfur subunit [Verrucomicrobia subdivision 3 bacterium]|nr:Cytochrome b6-f complex iron-sulfur subunit [Limisphaerales bacterium]MCS1414380.1 Cytochrome b6-f complex iron-sulfur subunit [Limisphaerales bacterium]